MGLLNRPAKTPEEELPPYVQTPADRERWDYARGIAVAIFGPDDTANVWQATRSIYQNGPPTQPRRSA